MEIEDIQITRGGTGGCDVKAAQVYPNGNRQDVAITFTGDIVTDMNDEQIKEYARKALRGGG